jgi:hypothetical protein
VHAFLGRFVAYPSAHAHVAHTLWIAHCHLMEAWDSTPRIAFLSPEPGSGKTRALEVSELLVPYPVEAVNVTPAYLFRKVGGEDGPPTILYDEIDTVFGPKAKDNEEIRGLLNAGHRRGAVAGRCVVRGKTVETEEIPAYSAVALAGIGWLPETLLSRSVIIRMRRRAAGEKVEPFRRRIHAPAGHGLRDKLAAWAAGNLGRVTDAWPALPPGIEDRNADVWEALLAVADAAGGDWPTQARSAAVALVVMAKEAEPSLGVRLLADLHTVFADAEAMSSAAILTALHLLDEAPWGDLHGRPLNNHGLAVRLRAYGIKPKQVRLGDVTLKGYARADLYDAWQRYLPASPAKSETGETNETTPGFQGGNVCPVSDLGEKVSDLGAARNPDLSRPVSVVSLVSPLLDHGGVPVCAQCGGTADKRDATRLYSFADAGTVRLHAACVRFYRQRGAGVLLATRKQG